MSRQGTPNTKKPAEVAAAKPATSTPPVAQSVEAKTSIESIRKRAFEIYQDRVRSGKPGNQASDWTQAEKDLSAKR